ncbi:MAG: MipA/OmpV family protein [Paracoccus sp. (in: a-proteobacteria)]|uniref:MipA/OmpV family protein n=1 Tax=Paracoccus sp. TaxID=267 RepID=UPI0026E08085|nr:MipA/OmpV family protein [Paracoccus sp. (in: a-proteobacteria)]MDO5622659.1 MipA/OmpV family protein [Paracoccus sp. (in: a-proteobacteria)]
MTKLAALAVAAAFAALPAGAQTLGYNVSADLGVGVQSRPEYPGAGDNEAAPWFILRDFSVSRGDAVSSAGVPQGFSWGLSTGLAPERDSGDYARLNGLDKVSRGVELGLRAGYGVGDVQGYIAARKAVSGHEGVVGEVGVRYSTNLNDRIRLTSRVEAQYGDSDYMNSYFGVSAAEVANGANFPVYEASGGIKAVQASLEARYALTDSSAILGRVTVGRLKNDAADSPITEDKNQFSVGIGYVRSLNFGF